MTEGAVKVFFSYSHKDEELRNELANHLRILERQGVISSWHDRKIGAGTEWANQIDDNLREADIILLLISSYFIASDYCYDIELELAMKRYEAGEALVVPIILRPVDWSGASFGKLQAFPKDAKAITTWDNQHEAFVNVTKGIRQAARLLLEQRQQKREAARKKAAIAEYRQKVEEFAADGEISVGKQRILDLEQERLGLTDEETRAVRDQALESHKKYKKNLDTYRQTFTDLVAQNGYPLGEKAKADLKLLQDYLELKDEDLAFLEEEAEEQKRQAEERRQQQEAERLQRQREQAEYENKLRQYEQELTRAIQKEYPLDEYVRDDLKNFRESLELTDEDVAPIEKPILEQAEAKYQEQLREEEANRHRQQEAKREKQREAEARLRQQQVKKQLSPVTQAQQTIKTQYFEFEVVTVDKRGSEISRSRSQAQYFSEYLGNGVTLEMVAIPGGKFMIGSPREEKWSSDDERPQHQVSIKPFFMGKYPVTQMQWRTVASLPKVNRDLNPDPSAFKGDNRPVEKVYWDDAVEFCARLSKLTKRDYRLPSEAEWEYACRAGTTTPYYFGKKITSDLVNCNFTIVGGIARWLAGRGTTEVGSYYANTFGLYDMHGNVWEWCADPWHDNYEGAPTDGSVWEIGRKQRRRVLRGGSWYDRPDLCRSAYRFFNNPDFGSFSFGVRVVCVPARTS